MRIMIYFELLFRDMVHTMEFYSTELILGFIASNGSYFQIFMEGTVNKYRDITSFTIDRCFPDAYYNFVRLQLA